MRNDTEGVLRALGLCAKARGLITGVPMICDAMSAGKRPFLVLAASDNAKNSEKRLGDKCAYYGVRLCTLEVDGETLARAVGKTARLAAVAVTDENLCRLVLSKLAKAE